MFNPNVCLESVGALVGRSGEVCPGVGWWVPL